MINLKAKRKNGGSSNGQTEGRKEEQLHKSSVEVDSISEKLT